MTKSDKNNSAQLIELENKLIKDNNKNNKLDTKTVGAQSALQNFTIWVKNLVCCVLNPCNNCGSCRKQQRTLDDDLMNGSSSNNTPKN